MDNVLKISHEDRVMTGEPGNRWEQAFLGSLAADALAMPVHWYYDTGALRREYGTVDRFLEPKNSHSGSILWRSEYNALNEKGDILRDQARYWGQRGIHYHQFLKAGENTLNFQLARDGIATPTSRNTTGPSSPAIPRARNPEGAESVTNTSGDSPPCRPSVPPWRGCRSRNCGSS